MTRRIAIPPCRVLADSREPHPDAGDHDDALFHPWHVAKNERIALPTDRVTLCEGDYSLPGFARWKPLDDAGEWRGEQWAVIERKSLNDAISTVVGGGTDALGEATANRDRFSEELTRMRDYAFRAIVIEGAPSCERCAVLDSRRNPHCVNCESSKPTRRFSAGSVLSSYAVFAVRFGVQVWWAGSRAGAEWYVGTVLARIWDEYVGGPACKKAIERGDVMPWIGRGKVEKSEAA